MPPKKANNKKQQTKAALLLADAEMKRDTKELVGAPLDSKLVTNGSETIDDEMKEPIKSKTKRGSGRVKNSVSADAAEEQTSVDKTPVAKGRGKNKKEIEVIKTEIEVKQEKKEEIRAEELEDKKVAEEITTKSKGRSGIKKLKTESKKTKASKNEIEKSQNTEGNTEEQADESNELIKAEKEKASVGKRKKQDSNVNKAERVVVKHEALNGPVEKVNKKSQRTKKAAQAPLDVEPPKKRGKSNPKESEKDDQIKEFAIEVNSNNLGTEIKAEKKTTKRGRNITKTALEIADTAVAQNGEIAEDVLPKKRSRKAPNDNKKIAAEKPKRGRDKKTEKVSYNSVDEEAVASLDEHNMATNGDIKEEMLEGIEESITQTAAEPTTTKARGGGRKRAAPSTNKKSKAATAEDKVDNAEDNEIEDEADGDSKPSKTKKKKDSAPLNPTGTKYNKEDFELAPLPEEQSADEPRYNLKISSWNVAGLRSWLKKEGLKFLEYEQPDIFCMQEIKCTTDQLPEEVERIPGYHPYWLCMPGGYAGVAIYSKIMPINVEYGIGNKEFDNCGRIITAEYEKFFLINVYVPNSGRKLVNLDARMKWEKIFQEFVQKLDARKPVVICGDMNVSHLEIDLANPKSNTRNAGFTKEERDKMTELLSLGFIDTFRHLYPDRKGAYTFWTYMGNARSRNVGWRLDYFIVSERFIKRVVDNCMRNQCMGSDHCPITLFMKL